ncbi:phosphoribosylamine--glycine ligase [Patescibacteria group bacterium]|nr:MAG: phosphoribosylamine--glycine ligase [Patescibacteria group bacterium]
MDRRTQNSVVVIGGGGREHALVWKLRQSPLVDLVTCIPGNAGIAEIAQCIPADLAKTDELTKMIVDLQPDLVVVGPEKPLADGLVDALAAKGVRVFGPSAAAAQIESSKAFAKRLMQRADVPTPGFSIAGNMNEASRYIRAASGPLVVKADGLCAGKGVVVCATQDEALAAAEAVLVQRIHGDAGYRVVVEERIVGRELSVMALCDGTRVLLLPAAQDYKRREDGDRGPMTGGMGAFSPSPLATPELLETVRTRILEPVVAEMKHEGDPFRGLLYAGLMITERGPLVLEFNCRFGDPETQVVLPRIEDDLYELLVFAAMGRFPSGIRAVSTSPRAAVCVVKCAADYPAGGSKDVPLTWTTHADFTDAEIFHAGTKEDGRGRPVTNGGRVLDIVGIGDTVAGARQRAYTAAADIGFAGEAFRTDIAADV